jgi:CheY-like chemotaxis protein
VYDGNTGARATILIAEDDDAIRDALATLLEEEGYRVVTARDGAEALARLHALPRPRLVLLDLMMPVMSGWEFLRRLRADPDTADIPVLVLSASHLSAPPEGASAFFSKPVRIGALLDSLEAQAP